MNDIGPLRTYYRALLPHYDASLQERGDLPFWESMVLTWHPRNILELGCGTGRVTAVLTRHAAVIAVDALVEMLDRAAGRAPKARLVAADFRSLPLRSRFDLVVVANDPMAHLTSTDDRRSVIESIAEHLTSDGRVILEGLYRPGRDEHESWKPFGRESLWQVTYRYGDVHATTLLRSWTQEEIDSFPRAGLKVEELWGDFDQRPFTDSAPRLLMVARRA